MALPVIRDLGGSGRVAPRQVGLQARSAGAGFEHKFHAPAIDKPKKPKLAPVEKLPSYGGLMMKGGY